MFRLLTRKKPKGKQKERRRAEISLQSDEYKNTGLRAKISYIAWTEPTGMLKVSFEMHYKSLSLIIYRDHPEKKATSDKLLIVPYPRLNPFQAKLNWFEDFCKSHDNEPMELPLETYKIKHFI